MLIPLTLGQFHMYRNVGLVFYVLFFLCLVCTLPNMVMCHNVGHRCVTSATYDDLYSFLLVSKISQKVDILHQQMYTFSES